MRALFSRPDLAASEPPSPATNLRLIEDEGQRAEAVDAIETLRRVLYRLLDWALLDDNESRAIDDDALPALARLDALLSGQATSLEELATWRNEGMRVCGAPGAVPA